jgi:hypothetical protein
MNFLDRVSKNTHDIKFNENPSSGSRAVSYGLTDRRDEANSCFSRFCDRAKKISTFADAK